MSTGRTVGAALLLVAGLVLGCCGLGTLAYGGLGAVMVHQAGEDLWVVGSLVVGAVATVLALVAVVVGGLLLVRRSSGQR